MDIINRYGALTSLFGAIFVALSRNKALLVAIFVDR
jgi:hypothetical protein